MMKRRIAAVGGRQEREKEMKKIMRRSMKEKMMEEGEEKERMSKNLPRLEPGNAR